MEKFVILHFLLNDSLEVLKVSNVTRCSNNCAVVDFDDSLQIPELGQRSVGAEHVTSKHDTTIKHQSQNGSSCGDRGPRNII